MPSVTPGATAYIALIPDDMAVDGAVVELAHGPDGRIIVIPRIPAPAP